MKNENTHQILAYYHFIDLENPHAEVTLHKDFFENRDIRSRIYISENGINGQMSAINEDAEAYINWMHSRNPFQDLEFKIHLHHEHVFPRKTVKYRQQLVALDAPCDLTKRGTHVSPKEWKEMLNSQEKHVLIDVRNDYEWKVGYFEGAELPACESFREFNKYAEELKQKHNPQTTPVMMYCTGGIRCELYSSILMEKGFEKVYQLDGGVINYGAKEGSDHWLGKLFVFDDRLTVPISDQPAKVVGVCHHCSKPSDNYYNCANMDCNALFISCPECIQEALGCCQESCKEASRLRPFHKDSIHKPFRKRHHYN